MLTLSCPLGAELRCAGGNNGLRCCVVAAAAQRLHNLPDGRLVSHKPEPPVCARLLVHVRRLGLESEEKLLGRARCCGAASCERLRAQSASHGPVMRSGSHPPPSGLITIITIITFYI